MSCGVIAVAGGAAASTRAGDAKEPAATAAEALRMSRLENLDVFIVGLLSTSGSGLQAFIH
jgi:hypothetical protein